MAAKHTQRHRPDLDAKLKASLADTSPMPDPDVWGKQPMIDGARSDHLDRAIHAATRKVDLFDIANTDILTHRALREWLQVAIRSLAEGEDQ